MTGNDLQCDFNSPFWEELDCDWQFSPTLMENLSFTVPLKRMERQKVTDLSSGFYWIRKDAQFDNYQLSGYYEGDYMIASAIQHTTGRTNLMFYPQFGFAYKGINTTIEVLFVENENIHSIWKHYLNLTSDDWHYFGKNLTEVTFLHDAWQANTDLDWQVTSIQSGSKMQV